MLEIEEGQRCRKRSENTHSHTLTAVRVFQQNPMTAGTNKKKISNDEEATLHSIPLCSVLPVLREKKTQFDAGFCELKIQVLSLINTSSWHNMCLKNKVPLGKIILKTREKWLGESSICAASLNCQLFSGTQTDLEKK